MTSRIHFLDQLRSHMMLLGVVLHVAGSFNTMPAGEMWPYKDVQTHGVLSFLVVFIHNFRMPAFFLVAGFFAALLLDRRGLPEYVRNRFLRVVLPFGLFLLPITFACGELFQEGAALMAERGTQIEFLTPFPLYHLWFLYYLTIYCVLAVPFAFVVKPAASWRDEARVRVARWLPWGLVLLLTLIHVLDGSYVLESPSGWMPLWGVLGLYAAFFASGYLLYFCRSAFFASLNAMWKWFALALVAVVAFLASLSIGGDGTGNPPVRWYGALALSIYYVALCWGILALYQRFLNRFSALGRYLSEASYWVYLVHLPLAIGIPLWLDGWVLPPLLKFAVVLVAVTLISLLTYHLLVRSTVIGALLNGKRHPFTMPWLVRSQGASSS